MSKTWQQISSAHVDKTVRMIRRAQAKAKLYNTSTDKVLISQLVAVAAKVAVKQVKETEIKHEIYSLQSRARLSA